MPNRAFVHDHLAAFLAGGGSAGFGAVLVLDHSGSMQDKASDNDTKSKMEALHEAAARFDAMGLAWRAAETRALAS